MSEIVKFISGPKLGGDEMPWGSIIVEGNRFLFCSGLTGRAFDKKQEYPELIERNDYTVHDQVSLEVCPHNIEDQVILIMEKYKALFKEAGTSFDNVFYVDYYLTDRYNWPTAWRTMKKWMDKECPDFFKRPRPNVLQIVYGLAHPDMLIEIKMLACVPE